MLKCRLAGPIPRINTRRLTLFLVFLSFSAVAFIIFLSSVIPLSPRLSDYDQKTKTTPAPTTTTTLRITDATLTETLSNSPLNPFTHQPSRAPARQKHDAYGGSSWWADWAWRSVPYSSPLTTDDRVLLPPLKERTPIYCYYDATIGETQEERDAESELLLTWKRAWWAQGFRPMILSTTEAMENPIYDQVQRMEVDGALQTDLMRWLAWDTMGGGLLSEYTVLPMGPKDDPLLLHLRRGRYPELTSWKGLRSGLLAGSGVAITSAVRAIVESPKAAEAKGVLAALKAEGVVHTDGYPLSLAYYSRKVIGKKYGAVAEAATRSAASGLQALNELMNAHLHTTWQNRFSQGIEVLKPHPNHTTKMVSDAIGLAESLLTCPETPIPSSCPPNTPKCIPCGSGSKEMKVVTIPHYRNSSNVFVIGVVPHPWTLATLDLLRDTLDVSWIRREMFPDPWVTEIMEELVDSSATDTVRVWWLKEAIASDDGEVHTLWVTAEDLLPIDLDWHFGFTIPKHPWHAAEKALDRDDPSEDPALEWILLERAKQFVETRLTEDGDIRRFLEGTNPADTEAWKFARAFQARRAMERAEWEQTETKYGQGSEGGGEGGSRNSWSRWQDGKGEQ
ncbi:hypothetical protein ACO1O0_006198 [Amphichorda felina]